MKVSLFYFILSSISNFSLSVYYIIIIKVVLQSWKSWNVALKIICQARVNKHTPNNSRKREKKKHDSIAHSLIITWGGWFTFSQVRVSLFFFLLSFLSIFFKLWHGVFATWYLHLFYWPFSAFFSVWDSNLLGVWIHFSHILVDLSAVVIIPPEQPQQDEWKL